MRVPQPSLIGKIWRWCRDLVLVPGRLRTLSEQAEADADARPKCRSCGTGRIGDIKVNTKEGFVGVFGRCDQCGVRWALHPNTGEPQHPAPDQNQG